MYLLDTNIWLERLLDQEKSGDVTAAKNHLTLVSFDGDFDRTELGRKTPEEIYNFLVHNDL